MTASTAGTLRRHGDGRRTEWDDDRGRLAFVTMIGEQGADTEQLTSGRCTVPPDGFLAEHAHEAAEIYVVLAGTALVTVAGHEHRLRPGDMLHIAPLAVHGVRNEGAEAFEFLFTYSADSMSDPRVAYRG